MLVGAVLMLVGASRKQQVVSSDVGGCGSAAQMVLQCMLVAGAVLPVCIL